MTGRYTFGDDTVAAGRLATLARVFAPTSRAFLWGEAPVGAATALDLGCGPGHTTALLAGVTGAARVIGIDRSAAFLAAAGSEAGASFVEHDVLDVPLPGAPADLVFCRFLLSHLPDPVAAMTSWAGQLAPGGRLLVEEVESIATEVEPFRRYLGHVAGLLAANGQRLDVGPAIHAAAPPAGVVRRSSKVATLQPVGADVVAMFRPNLATWRHDPVIDVPAEALDALDAGLVAQADRPSGAITWRLRQVVWERTSGPVR